MRELDQLASASQQAPQGSNEAVSSSELVNSSFALESCGEAASEAVGDDGCGIVASNETNEADTSGNMSNPDFTLSTSSGDDSSDLEPVPDESESDRSAMWVLKVQAICQVPRMIPRFLFFVS